MITAPMKKGPLIDFTTTQEYEDFGWGAYLPLHAKKSFDMNAHFEVTTEKDDDKKFGYLLLPAQTIGADKIAYAYEENSKLGKSLVKYDAWGRAISDVNVDYTFRKPSEMVKRTPVHKKPVVKKHIRTDITDNADQVPVRGIEGSPIEAQLLQADPKNYCMFLNAYFQELQEKLRPFERDNKLSKHLGNLTVKTKAQKNPLPSENTYDVLSQFIRTEKDIYSDEAMKKKIETGNDLQDVAVELTNAIAVCETLRGALWDQTCTIGQKAHERFAYNAIDLKDEKSEAFKKQQKDMLGRQWGQLASFTPKAMPKADAA